MSRHVLDFEIPDDYVPDDDTMELLSALYGYMDKEEIKSWSLQDVYEVIREFIEQDAEDEND